MNYFELTIICRVEDISSIENDLKDIIWARKLALRWFKASLIYLWTWFAHPFSTTICRKNYTTWEQHLSSRKW
jgi:hypothetical protein